MRTMFNRPWLIIATCLFASACTDKTVVSGPSAGSDAEAATETAESTTLGDTVATPDLNLSDTIDAVESEESSPTLGTAAANMVDVNVESNNEASSNSQTTIMQLSPDQAAAAVAAAADDLDESTQDTIDSSNESTPDSSSETAVAETTPGVDELLADPVVIPDVIVDTPIEFATIGAPGANVNCELALPCRWLSDDSQFFVTVTSADNIGALGELVIEYSVSSLHDTEVSISSTEAAIDSAGGEYQISAFRLGEAEGEAEGADAQALLAGESVPASIQFDSASSADSINFWSIGLSDSGLERQPVFSGLPIGSATTLAADCANALPCVWQSPAGDVTITLQAVSGAGSVNQLSASFEVEATRDLTVAVDAGATATGTDGMSYRGRTHTIGSETGSGKVTGNTIAGSQIVGTVFFFRTQSISEALQTLSLIVYEDGPVPRWNPEFFNVPVQ